MLKKEYRDMLGCWQRFHDSMKEKGVRLTDIARKTGILQQTLSKQIIHDTLPDIDQAYKICTLLNISMEYFTKGKEQKLSKFSEISIKIAYAAENLNDEGKNVALNTVKGLELSYPVERKKAASQ